MFRRLLCSAAVAAMLVGAAQCALGSGAAIADTTSQVGVTSASDLLAVPATDAGPARIVLAGSDGRLDTAGPETGAIITDGAGANPVQVGTLREVRSLALAPNGETVYATSALDAIASFGAHTPDTVAVHPLPTNTCPSGIAVAGDGRVWFSYGCDSAAQDLAVLDPADDSITWNLGSVLFGRTMQNEIILRNARRSPNTVVLAERASDGLLAVLDVSNPTPVVQAHEVTPGAIDLEVAADGASLLVIDQDSRASASRLSTVDLHSLASYPADFFGMAVAVSDDDAYVAVITSSPNTVYSYGPHTDRLIRTGALGGVDAPAPRGATWLGDELVVATKDAFGGPVTLRVRTSSIQAPVTVTASGPATKTRGSQLTISGDVRSRSDAVASSPLVVTRTDLSGTHTLPGGAHTNSAGHFTFRDHPSVGSTNTYTVRYAGDATHAASSRSVKVSVSRSTPSLSLTTNKSHYNYGGIVTVHAHLGSTFNGRTVTLYGQGLGFKKVLLRTGRVDRHGNISARAQVGVRATLWVSFPGDYHYAPRTVKVVRTVAAQLVAVLGKTKHHTGKYSVYPQKKGAVFAAGVAPNKAGECLRFVLQHHTRTGWHTGANRCFALDRTSVTGVVVGGATHTQYRIRAEYHGDRANTKKTGNWHYFEFS